MREIKFRVYGCLECDNKYKMFYDNLSFNSMFIPSYLGRLICVHKTLQYTGMKDKNGKEIYEGDIVKHLRQVILAGPHADGADGWGDWVHTGDNNEGIKVK